MNRVHIVATALFVFTAAQAFPPDRAQADANARYCAQTFGKSDGLSCNYATYEQCRAFVNGLAGSCIENPYYRRASGEAPRRR